MPTATHWSGSHVTHSHMLWGAARPPLVMLHIGRRGQRLAIGFCDSRALQPPGRLGSVFKQPRAAA